MFVLVRSAICIGLVVAALPDRPGQATVTDGPGLAAVAAAPAMATLARYCAANPGRCRLALDSTLDAARESAAAPRRKPSPRAEGAAGEA